MGLKMRNMGSYRFEAINKETGEVLISKEYTELFDMDKDTKISRKWKLIYYCSNRFGILRQNIGVMGYKYDGKDYVFDPESGQP